MHFFSILACRIKQVFIKLVKLKGDFAVRLKKRGLFQLILMKDCDSLGRYMQEIGAIPLLTRDEEIRCYQRMHDISLEEQEREAARYRLITGNLRLVVKIAHDFKDRGVPLQELICEGNRGLTRGVEKFDPSRGAKLSSYAAWWIKTKMRLAIAKQSNGICISYQMVDISSRIRSAYTLLEGRLERPPTRDEIAEETGISRRRVDNYFKHTVSTVSLSDCVHENENMAKAVNDDGIRALAVKIDIACLDQLLSRIDSRKMAILEMRFGLNGYNPMSLQQVACRIGRTRERVRQLEIEALKELRKIA
jgi:RNA polymerase primary sigma factor